MLGISVDSQHIVYKPDYIQLACVILIATEEVVTFRHEFRLWAKYLSQSYKHNTQQCVCERSVRSILWQCSRDEWSSRILIHITFWYKLQPIHRTIEGSSFSMRIHSVLILPLLPFSSLRCRFIDLSWWGYSSRRIW